MPNVFSRRHRGQGASATARSGCRSSSGGRGAIEADTKTAGPAAGRDRRSRRCCGRDVVLDLLANFTVFATDTKKRRIKIICRYQQYEGANQIVERVVAGHPKKGLIWHFQGSGKSLLMVFAAQKLRLHPALRNPTVLIVVDRIDLDTQITGTFNAADMPNLVKADTPRGAAAAARRRTCARSSSPRSTSSARPTACSTTATTSSCWSTRPTAPRKATSAARCARRCPTRSCSA